MVAWKVAAKVFSETKVNFCQLCLTGKVFIKNGLNGSQLLNQKSNDKYIRQQNKLLLKILRINKRILDRMD